MGCTVRELLVRIDSRELREWMAFYQIEPFGEQVVDYRESRLAAILANAFRGKNQRPYGINDFSLIKQTPKRQSWQKMRDMLQAYCNRLRGKK